MAVLFSLVSFYIRSSLHVAVAMVALTLVASFDSMIAMDYSFLVLVFCGTLIGYNVIKYGLLWWEGRWFIFKKAIGFLTLGCFLVALALLWSDHYASWGIVVLISVLSALYAVPLLFGRNLRSFAWVKTSIVATVWVLVAGYWKYFTAHAYFIELNCLTAPTNSDWMVNHLRLIIIGIYVFASCILFEIEDYRLQPEDSPTIASLLGAQRARQLAMCLLACAILLSVYNSYVYGDQVKGDLLFFVCCLGVFFLQSKIRHPWFVRLGVEALPLLWYAVILLRNA